MLVGGGGRLAGVLGAVWWWWWCWFWFGAAEPVAGDAFTVGYISGSQRRPGDRAYDRPGYTISGAVSYAVAEVNAAHGTLGRAGHHLAFIWADTYGDEETSILHTAQLWTRNVSAYIGPQETCAHEGRMAASFNLPMISYFCTDHDTSDKMLFPTFARTRPPDTQISKSVAAVLLHFQWTHVVFLYLNSTQDGFTKVAGTILETLQINNIHVEVTRTWSTVYHHRYMKNPFYDILKETSTRTRIYLILGYYYEHLGLLVAMADMNLLKTGDYFVVGVDIEQYESISPAKYLRGFLTDDRDPYAERAFGSYLSIVPSAPGADYDDFTNHVNFHKQQPPFNFEEPLVGVSGITQVRPEAAYLYDAVHLYANAIVSVLEAGGNPRNGTTIVNAIKGQRYESAMGYMVNMDENADAEGNYTLLGRRTTNNTSNIVGLFPVGIFAPSTNSTQLPVLQLTAELTWVGGRPPVAIYPCGFLGEKCLSYSGEILGGIVGGMTLVLLIILLVVYRNWRYEQELDSLLWKVDFRDIEIHAETNATAAANGTTGTASTGNPAAKTTRAYHPLMRTSQVSLSSNPDADFRYSSIFTKIGVYKGRIYAIKHINKETVIMNREIKKELKMMRDLRHNNLNAFIGACTEPPNVCIITEYCTRGSLKDILENEEVNLDNMFVASIVADILRGLIYLHDSAIRYHGALCTSNCLVDSRWVVKLADFGLEEFKRYADESQKFVNDPSPCLSKCKALLYQAPELLRGAYGSALDANYIPVRGTQKADVYSFSIILYELHSRHGPFGETGFTAAEILHRVIYHDASKPPFRPNLESLETRFDFVLQCLKECWAEIPEDRPDFKTIRTKLRPLRKGMKPNIFDNMMAMMEKYANNLEVLVDERTDQLQQEKRKTEALLLEMLPRPVAEQLKRGQKVEAESFDCVTIYFSDIVGFTSMSAQSTPLQVVDFLNDLYTCFDSIIEHYDVYKVETIGDAYMVVSGLPIRNGDEHAAEIATMSLHLLSAVKKFTIRHRPFEQLKLRIGIHSGPVCAGVVGLKMPRYCLFGDTVNTTSRMESTGLPLKIHCSHDCKLLLDNLGGYMMLERGFVEMKGKGEQVTYWLAGEDKAKRLQRNEARHHRRALASGKAIPNGLHTDMPGMPSLPRSSLKNRNTHDRCAIPRCISLESPKRLRFASGDRLELFHHKQPLEVIDDSSPIKHSSGSLDTVHAHCSSDCLRNSSTSCPCIAHMGNVVTPVQPPRQLMLLKSNTCLSVPALTTRSPLPNRSTDGLTEPRSVPSTPKQISVLALNTQFLSIPFINPEFISVSTPLLTASATELGMNERETPFKLLHKDPYVNSFFTQ